MSRYTHVLFDLDGTLIDSAPAIVTSFRDAFARAGVTPVIPIDDSIIGPPLTETLELLSGTAEPDLIAALAEHFKVSYDSTGLLATTAYDGIAEMLHALHTARLSLSIATNKRILPTRLILEHLGWRDLFDHVYALDLFKPRLHNKAEMIRRLVVDHGIPIASSVYVGDRCEDGESADANTLPFIATTWGYGSLVASEMEAHWQAVETPTALAARILKF